MIPNQNKFNPKKYAKLYYLKNKYKFQKPLTEKQKEKARIRASNWYKKNKKRALQNVLKYRKKNYKKHLEWNKKWKLRNPIKYKETARLWRLKNKKYSHEKRMKRLKNDINFRIKHNLRKRVWDAVKNNFKGKKTLELLGCSIEFLKKHLSKKFKKGMTFKNYGEWHVDHIKPCASFDLCKLEEQKICFHYSNLQPLWAKDNIKKGAYYAG